MTAKYPYPTLLELVGLVSDALGLNIKKNKLKGKTDELIINPKVIYEIINVDVLKPLKTMFYESEPKPIIDELLLQIVKNYIKFISFYPADGMERGDVIKLLTKAFFAPQIALVINYIFNLLKLPESEKIKWFMIKDESLLPIIIKELEQKNIRWSESVASKIHAWKNSEYLPQFYSIELLRQEYGQSIAIPILIASVLDRIRKDQLGRQLFDEIKVIFGTNDFSLERKEEYLAGEFFKAQKHFLDKCHQVEPVIDKIVSIISSCHKAKEEKEILHDSLSQLEIFFEQNNWTDSGRYWLEWNWAKFYVLSGDLEAAYQKYKLSVEGCLYRTGKKQQDIISQALVVTANLTKPDNIFLKKLKWAAITFEYDIPSIEGPKLSNRIEDNIQDWEIDMWKNSFYKIFPKEAFFPDCELFHSDINTSGLSSINELKPDYQNPNRVYKINDFSSKPQIMWFILKDQNSIVEKLLQKGAKVDIPSQSNETPIMLALQKMNLFTFDFIPPDEIYFNLLLKYADVQQLKSTINTISMKKRLSPLTSAVESGQLHVVEKVLALGADINLKSTTGNETALSYCLKRIGALKNPKRYFLELFKLAEQPSWSIIDTIRRYSSGHSGFTQEQVISFLQGMKESPLNNSIENILVEIFNEYINKYTSIDKLRSIAKLLIDHGSDINIEIDSVIKGYTPFMLAAEMDEVELFKSMYEHGGDLSKTYRDHRTHKDINIKEIASYFKSKGILDFLNTLKQ